MNRCSFREWIPILPWPVWPLAGQCLLGQKTVVGSMRILLLAVRGNIARRSMSGPRFLYNFTTPRLGVELPLGQQPCRTRSTPMAKHTALLLGCGTIGAEVARLLVADEVFSGVLIADQDVARAQQIAAEVGEKATPLQADVYDEATVARCAQGASVVLNTTGPFTKH